MGMTTEYNIFEIGKMTDDVKSQLYLPKYGTVLDDKWLVVLNAEHWGNMNPYYALLEALENIFGMEWEEITALQLKVDCYLGD